MSSSQRLCLPASGCWAIGHLLCPDPTIPYKASLADGDDREVGLLPAANEFEPTPLFAGIGMLGHRAPPLPRSYHPLQGVFGGRILKSDRVVLDPGDFLRRKRNGHACDAFFAPLQEQTEIVAADKVLVF